VRHFSLRNSGASARALFLCPAPIPSPQLPVGMADVGGMAGSAHRIGSALPRSSLRVAQFKRAYSSPPVLVSGNMASADFSTITQRIAARGAPALAVACGRDLPR
jgi:hypothetical protein